MSELDFKKMQRELMSRIIVAIVAGLFLMIVGGGITMSKIFNVQGKADKEYVDKFYGDMMRLMENRTLVLEGMVNAEKDMNIEKLAQLQKQLDDLTKQWQLHMSYHMERTRGSGIIQPI